VILVAGGTGRLGSLVVADLLARGNRVRVLSRGTGPVPQEVAPSEVMAGSVTDPAALEKAVEGVDLVVSAVTGFPRADPARVDAAGNELLVQAAEGVGAEVVLVSVAGAAPDSAMGLFRAKFEAEQALGRSSVRGTIIRPEAFADLWIDLLATTARRSRRPLVFGRGDTPTGWVAVGDVAALVTRVVEQASLRGTTYTLSGPERISVTELARRLMASRGWPGSPRHLPVAALHVTARLPGRSGRQAEAALAMDQPSPVHDDTRTRVPGLPSTPLAELLGRAAVRSEGHEP
jgi:NADH dehydrogenase